MDMTSGPYSLRMNLPAPSRCKARGPRQQPKRRKMATRPIWISERTPTGDGAILTVIPTAPAPKVGFGMVAPGGCTEPRGAGLGTALWSAPFRRDVMVRVVVARAALTRVILARAMAVGGRAMLGRPMLPQEAAKKIGGPQKGRPSVRPLHPLLLMTVTKSRRPAMAIRLRHLSILRSSPSSTLVSRSHGPSNNIISAYLSLSPPRHSPHRSRHTA